MGKWLSGNTHGCKIRGACQIPLGVIFCCRIIFFVIVYNLQKKNLHLVKTRYFCGGKIHTGKIVIKGLFFLSGDHNKNKNIKLVQEVQTEDRIPHARLFLQAFFPRLLVNADFFLHFH